MLKFGEKGNITVNRIVCDSRQAGPDAAFVCIKGAVTDGHLYAAQAYRTGCRVFVCERELSLPSDAVIIKAKDARLALAELSAEIFSHPADRLKLIGITGTKGKTTTATFIYDILNAAGHKTALIGTTGIFIGARRSSTVNTTPESNILHQTLAEALEWGAEYVVMEVSSQAYKQRRVAGLNFAFGVFTNLSHGDHVGPGEHPDYEDYRACKAKLFAFSDCAVLNADDSESLFMARSCPGEICFYSAAGAAPSYGFQYTGGAPFFAAEDARRQYGSGAPGVSFLFNGLRYNLNVPGVFNVSNAMAAITVCKKIGVAERVMADTLAKTVLYGRFEPVMAMDDRTFIIDYAHNGVSLEFALRTLGEYNPGRLVCVFGSVGGRTQLRRGEMGEIAAAYADYIILTSDNPDKENPSDIIADIERGVGACPHINIPDRNEAVEYAVLTSRPGDMVLFAGKGHEKYQLINGRRVPFDERAVIMEAAKKLKLAVGNYTV